MKRVQPHISIVIPVLNEGDTIGNLLTYLNQRSFDRSSLEVIVVDGGSTDKTFKIAGEFNVTVLKSLKGRAKQMNAGAKIASANILYFLHADTFPPKNFDSLILDSVKNGSSVGCFRMHFDSASRFLRFFAWFSRINHPICRGGDQSLFITQELFLQTQGFNEKYLVYEDNEFIARLSRKNDFKILPEYVTTSARKYKALGMVRLQYHFGVIHFKNYMGAGPEQLHAYYKKKIGSQLIVPQNPTKPLR
ncbi:MAG: TIGR04283 family arsenosugar biosynthesis glycosyltransferase [Maribacter sp.]|nr:TIGR04283 family arsenosugar biosynthesis glycosyltransferase [Maribacter sp.]